MSDTDHETAIVIMGPDGSGKSNFIDALSRREAARQLDGDLRRPFGQVQPIVLSSQAGIQLAFVEFPGFDSNVDARTNAETLRVIGEWLEEAFSNSVIIAGVLYMHNLSNNTTNTSASVNLRVFQALCGDAALPRTALITSGWDLVRHEVGQRQEEELENSRWRELREAGSHYAKFDNTHEGAWSIVNNLMKDLGNNRGQTFLIHREIEVSKLKLSETRVGKALLNIIESTTSKDDLVAVLDGWTNLARSGGLRMGWKRRIPALFGHRKFWKRTRFWKNDTNLLSDPPDELYPLVIRIARNHEARRFVGGLKGEDAQHMVQYLDEILGSNTLTRRDRKYLLALFSQFASSAVVYPSTYLLQSGISLEPRPVSTRGTYPLHHGRLKNQLLCIKLLPEFPDISTEEFRKVRDHVREIALWNHLHHPNILPFLGITGSRSPTPRIAFVSPWIRNQNLQEYLQTHHGAPKIRLLFDVVEGLDYLHQHGIVHGDICMSNILVSDEGHAQILDFKASLIYLGTNDPPDRPNHPWASSPHRMAPELLRVEGYRAPTKRSDVWSFACLCYEVLEEKCAFYQYESPWAVCIAMARNSEIPKRLSPSKITDDLWNFLVLCWDYSPDSRPKVRAIHDFFVNMAVRDDRPRTPSLEEIIRLRQSLREKAQIHVNYQRIYEIAKDTVTIFSDLLVDGTGGTESEDDIPSEQTDEDERSLDDGSESGWLKHFDGSPSQDPDNYSNLRNLLVKFMRTKPFQGVLDILENMQQEDSQIMADFIDTVLQESNILNTKRHHLLRMLCKLASSAGAYPKSYELGDVLYDPQECIGQGGYADVYKGSHQQRIVCVKVFRRAQDEHSLNAYVKELTMWAHLSHPNILPFYGVYLTKEAPSRPNPVSPYMRKGNLSTYARGLLPSDRLPLIYDVIQGLSYLHRLGIVHSDLKGNNVLVSDDLRALITDFGTSHIASASRATTRGITNSPIGYTARWAAPELLEAAAGLRPKKSCDIWSFGCLCYEILSGRVPFHRYEAQAAVITAIMIKRELPTRPIPHEQDCDMIEDWMWDLMKKCWEFKPALRLGCKDIEGILRRVGIQGSRPSLSNSEALPAGGPGQRSVELDLAHVGRVLRHIDGVISNKATLGGVTETPRALKEIARIGRSD
ncbi:hypothetical protein D9756_006742 [Leucocoprinus leucothites]|uniref:Protein kinase domain-containing protein n=1 Tax=Leucocoprinus leucothites TaxID=201217 RepID=A0A8H5LH12_9AGAR|nr:hypothetical protein D9756_006742 [Leucoagaricus leucothites]